MGNRGRGYSSSFFKVGFCPVGCSFCSGSAAPGPPSSRGSASAASDPAFGKEEVSLCRREGGANGGAGKLFLGFKAICLSVQGCPLSALPNANAPLRPSEGWGPVGSCRFSPTPLPSCPCFTLHSKAQASHPPTMSGSRKDTLTRIPNLLSAELGQYFHVCLSFLVCKVGIIPTTSKSLRTFK